ncbi:unnamed protein product [Parnassius mnemosyne]|uniref:Uncharacterized protein n=1 Tax=Parnassius mnemosyne TaxID=213953 RepID=A0AAV1LXQ9_9NEOP
MASLAPQACPPRPPSHPARRCLRLPRRPIRPPSFDSNSIECSDSASMTSSSRKRIPSQTSSSSSCFADSVGITTGDNSFTKRVPSRSSSSSQQTSSTAAQ